jgi:hypothetical protein
VPDRDRRWPRSPAAAASPAAPAAQPDTQATAQPGFRAGVRRSLLRTHPAPRHARRASTASQCLAGGRQSGASSSSGDTGCRIKVTASGSSRPIQDCTSPAPGPGRGSPRPRPAHTRSGDPRRRLSLPRVLQRPRALRAAVGQRRGHRLRLGRLECRLLHPGGTPADRRPLDRRARQSRELRSRRRRLDALPLAPALPDLQQPVLQDRQPFAAGQQPDGRRLSHRPRPRADAGHRRQRGVSGLSAGHCPTPRWRDLQTPRCSAAIAPGKPAGWLLTHKPLWYDLLSLQRSRTHCRPRCARTLPANLQFLFAGHEHAFQTINFSPAPTRQPSRGAAGADDRRRQRHPARSLRSAFAVVRGDKRRRQQGEVAVRRGSSTMASPPAAASSSTATASCCSNAAAKAGPAR